ncbi:MAG: hypothetical protein PHS49_08260 [Candidatus Gracilibacteria bacterium]|nr:hypothetical protein [Candidatus Gracilibacteria bacterium]
MLKKFFYLIVAIFAIMSFQFTNASENGLDFSDDGKTIKELKESIDVLDRASLELDQELVDLNADYELKSYLRTDLSLVEINKIKILVANFNRTKTQMEDLLQEKAKKMLAVVEDKKAVIELKRSFYNSLIPYINYEYNNEYLEYIKTDAKIFSEQKDLSLDIVAKKEILSNKVEKIEGKIQEHKDYINKSLSIVIEKKLDEKVSNLANNESFKVLSSESKRKVLDKTIAKIKDKLNQIIKTNKTISGTGTSIKINNDLFDKKVQTFQIAVDKLQDFRDSIK